MLLKGRTKIELFKNGKPVLTHEESNLVTNMMSDTLTSRLGPAYLSGNCKLNPTTLYKGLLLFRDSVTENAAQYGIPGNNEITGRGYESNTLSADLDTGVFNTNLSTQTNNRISYVWDFDEEHGNGRISCVSLVTQNLAKYLRKTAASQMTLPPCSDGFANEPVLECLSATTLPVYVDVTNQTMYCIALSAAGTLAISKYFLNQLRPIMGSAGMTDFIPDTTLGNRTLKVLDSCYFTSVASVDLSQIITANGTYSFMVCDPSGFLYICCTANANIATNGTVNVAKVNVKTGAVTTYTLTNYSNETIRLQQTGVSGTRYCRPGNFVTALFGGYFWFETTSNHILAINIEANSTYHICTAFDGTTVLTVSALSTNTSHVGGFYTTTESEATGTTGQYRTRFVPIGPKSIAVLENESSSIQLNAHIVNIDSFSVEAEFPEALYSGSYGGRGRLPGWPIITDSGLNIQIAGTPGQDYWGSTIVHFGGCFWQPMLWGLQTINNLDSPVIKTADLTMRVTYVLEEEEPVGMTTPELAAAASENAGGGE